MVEGNKEMYLKTAQMAQKLAKIENKDLDLRDIKITEYENRIDN